MKFDLKTPKSFLRIWSHLLKKSLMENLCLAESLRLSFLKNLSLKGNCVPFTVERVKVLDERFDFDYVLKVAACEINKHFPEGGRNQFELYILQFCVNRKNKMQNE